MQAPLVPGIHFETAPSHDREVTCPFASSVPNHTCSVFCILSPDAPFLPPIRPSTRRFLKLPSSSHGTDVRLAIYQTGRRRKRQFRLACLTRLFRARLQNRKHRRTRIYSTVNKKKTSPASSQGRRASFRQKEDARVNLHAQEIRILCFSFFAAQKEWNVAHLCVLTCFQTFMLLT